MCSWFAAGQVQLQVVAMATANGHSALAVGQWRHGSLVVGVAVEVRLTLEPGPFGKRSRTHVVRVDEQRRGAALPGDCEMVHQQLQIARV